jgi:putative nucleotidyltransferase with HDIG domain
MRVGRGRVDLLALTNGARWVLIYVAAAMVYGTFGRVDPPSIHAGEVIGGATATFVSFTLSLAMIILSSKIRTGQSLQETWTTNNWVAPHYLAMGILGIALGAAYVALGILGIIAFLTPAVMLRIAMKQYVSKTAENVEKLQQQNTALSQANVHIQRISDELREGYDGTLDALVNALDARDQETKGHSLRVSRYMLDIAREMGVKEGTQQWIDMQRGSLLHDVGKIGVADGILLKPGKLTEDEWELMRRHPEIGYNMLSQVQFLKGASEIILAHHERWDGEGYPKRLAHEDIPFGARIFMVCDTFDSMTSDRPYRKALSTQVALEEILKYSGSQFDPQVVEAFLDIYDQWVKERDNLHAIDLHYAA